MREKTWQKHPELVVKVFFKHGDVVEARCVSGSLLLAIVGQLSVVGGAFFQVVLFFCATANASAGQQKAIFVHQNRKLRRN